MKTFYKPRTGGTLKAAVAGLVAACGGTVRSAELLRKSQSTVQAYTDEAEPDRQMGIGDVRTLEASCGRPIVTEFLAAEAGCVLLPIAVGDDNAPLGVDFARLGAEASALFGDYAGASADGRIDRAEAGRMIGLVDRLLAAGAAIRAELKPMMGDER